MGQDDGSTPLFTASAGGHVEVIRLLLRAGATVNYATVSVSRVSLACEISSRWVDDLAHKVRQGSVIVTCGAD
jgi:ankyrin repeat protein